MSIYYLSDAQGVLAGPVELPIIPGIGIQLPSNAVSLKQELATPPVGECWVLVNDEATLLADHRGVVYSTETGEPEQHDAPGALPEGRTAQPRPSPDYAWVDEQWQLDDELQADNAEAARKALHAQIDAERDARIDAGVEFQGVKFQSRVTDRENIAGAAQLGFMAIVAGAEVGDLRWSNLTQDFAWIAADNSLAPMDAQTVVQFGKAAAERKQALIFAARQIKDMQPIPSDYTDDKWWP